MLCSSNQNVKTRDSRFDHFGSTPPCLLFLQKEIAVLEDQLKIKVFDCSQSEAEYKTAQEQVDKLRQQIKQMETVEEVPEPKQKQRTRFPAIKSR